MRWLLLVLLEEIGGLIQDVSILWDEEVSVPFMNLKLLSIRQEVRWVQAGKEENTCATAVTERVRTGGL